VRFKVLMVVNVKIVISFEVMACNVVQCTDVSEDFAASIICPDSGDSRVHCYQTTWHHVPEDSILYNLHNFIMSVVFGLQKCQ
jgi:hypothetical protein